MMMMVGFNVPLNTL